MCKRAWQSQILLTGETAFHVVARGLRVIPDSQFQNDRRSPDNEPNVLTLFADGDQKGGQALRILIWDKSCQGLLA